MNIYLEFKKKKVIVGAGLDLEELFNTWKPRKKFELIKDTDFEPRVLPHKLTY